jgi:peroxin-5
MVADDLAATAGMLLESVKDEQNPKFQNSSFMRLMHLLHDREVVVDGNDMVERSSGAPASTSASPWVEEFERQVQMDKGKGRAVEPGSTSLNQISLPMSPAPMYNGPLYNPGIPLSQGLFAGGLAQQQMPHITDTLSSARLSSALDNEFARLASEQPTTTRRKSVHFESASDSQQEASSSSEAAPQVNWDEDFTMDDFQKNMNMEQLSKEMGMGGIQNMSGLEQIAEWERLQRDWDNFEASATGIRPVSSYEFQANNPYLGRAEEAGMTRNHLMHQGAVQSLSQVRRSQLNLSITSCLLPFPFR